MSDAHSSLLLLSFAVGKNNNKTGLQPVSIPVEKFLVFSYSLQKLPKSVVTIKVKLGNRKRKGANSLQL